jgi:hypothetical protein
MRKQSMLGPLLGGLLVAVGYLLGGNALRSERGNAYAGPLWDAEHSSYVTGDAETLTIWKMEEGKVVGVTTWMNRGQVFFSVEGKPGTAEDMPKAAPMAPAQPAPPAGCGGGKSCG